MKWKSVNRVLKKAREKMLSKLSLKKPEEGDSQTHKNFSSNKK